jgi:hypothetical protein
VGASGRGALITSVGRCTAAAKSPQAGRLANASPPISVHGSSGSPARYIKDFQREARVGLGLHHPALNERNRLSRS